MLNHELNSRRDFLFKGASAVAAAGLSVRANDAASSDAPKRNFKISVDGWTFHREVFGGKIKQLDLFKVVAEEFDIHSFALVNNMLEVPTAEYTKRLASAAKKSEVYIPLIMVDDEGSLGHADAGERAKAVRNHAKWIYMASDLGCHSVRVNWRGGELAGKDEAKMKEFIERSADAFGKLTELGKQNGQNIIIENHGGPSSYPETLIALMKAVNQPTFGILPDFGNFPKDVDKYDAVDKFMPYAKAVSAKCHDFDDQTGLETEIDFERMVQICVDKHGYHGYMGVEYEGSRLSEREGLKRGRDLLKKLQG